MATKNISNLSFDWIQYKDYLHNSCLFRGIPEDKYTNVLSCLQARMAVYKSGSSLVNAGDSNFRAGILLEGNLEEYIYDDGVLTWKKRLLL